MNGTFTEQESRHMTAIERAHYLELGLCAPVDHAGLERLLDQERADKEDLQDRLDEANENAGCSAAELEELEELRYRVGKLQLKAAKLTDSELREELAELLD